MPQGESGEMTVCPDAAFVPVMCGGPMEEEEEGGPMELD